MPRPKVRPEDRQRSRKACSACKGSKIRCDSELPCSSCTKRGQSSSCEYSDIDRRRRHHGTRLDAASTLTASARVVPASRSRGPPTTNAASASSEVVVSPIIRTPPTTCTTTRTDIAPESTPSPRNPMLDGSAGEQGLIGTTEDASFLCFLRKTLRPFIGNIRFTDSKSQNVVHGMEDSQIVETDDFQVSVEHMYFLLDSYFEATSGLLDLFTADEIDSLISERATSPCSNPSPTINRENLAALDVALAIGAQTQPHTMRITDPRLHVALLSRACRIAFEDMLMSPSLERVRLFLLMAFYMLGACNRNAASMYLGVACKAADVLGLRSTHSGAGSQLGDHDLRLRTLNSLTVVNVLASFILDSRQSTPLASVELNTSGNAKAVPAEHDQSTFSAILEGCLHIESIVKSLRTGHMLHVPTAECLLEQLRHWTESLRGPLRLFMFSSTAELDSADRQALIGHAHLSCVYYFAVILITRPFLVVYLVSRLRGRAPDHLIDDLDQATDVTIKNNKVSKLAQVCVSAATCMIRSLQKAQATRFSFGNLCLLKAWVFGSGLVLGFSMFAGEPRQDIQAAFQGACDVLDSISQISPQAQVYHSILTDFEEAVGKYQHRVTLEISKTVQYYLDTDPFLNTAQGEGHHPSSPFHLDNVRLILEEDGALNLGADKDQGDLTMDVDLQLNWLDLDLHLVDNSLVFTTEPFQGLFWSLE
ncbi:hypothetical protein EDB81DRAFT_693101 [Dactylonectria macrodidyma]|uniref:Zn(2)-C6 fungal-type domain-containing protein n=1 Tax=Dactylonectria macrodidyma TaxID=307937 RepID=A0A9P9EE97_9HYPO|nr:hypothetical protein EDB81DRAFT_693101 [Dactylonectria macrodidyma]